MKLLVFHNILFAQYKSIYFEKLYNDIVENNKGDFLVIQTAWSEKARMNHFDKETLLKNIKYPYFLISKTKPLEEISSVRIFIQSIFHIFTFKPSIVNFTGYNSWPIFFLLLICKMLGIKTIITNESVIKNSVKTSNIIDTINKLIKKIIVSQSDYFYTFGINANNLLFDLNVPKNRILNFGNTFSKNKLGVGNTKNKLEGDTLKFLFIGRLSDEKNLFQSIYMLSLINQKYPLIFDIYGDGNLSNELSTYCKINHYNFVNFKPPIKWENIYQIYPIYDYLLLLSKIEPWGMVANEALHFNVKVICSLNCGCANDLVINEKNGLILDLENEKESIIKLETYLNLKNKTDHFIDRNNLIFDETYTIKKFIEKINTI